jgi:Flp pilus assembly protein TadG
MKKRGAAVVEAAVILPFIVLLTLGMIDVGYYLKIHQHTTLSSREAARHGATPTATPETIEQVAQEAYWGKPYADITEAEKNILNLNVSGHDSERGAPVAVTVSLDYEDVALFPPIYGQLVTSTCVMRRE